MATRIREAVLTEFEVKNYRSARDTGFNPHPRLSALIGINGAGKTTILGAIRLLSAGLPRLGARRASEEAGARVTQVTAWFDVAGERVGLRLLVTLGVSARGNDDVLSVQEQWNFSSLNHRGWKALPDFVFVGPSGRAIQYSEIALRWNRREHHLLADRDVLRYAEKMPGGELLRDDKVMRAVAVVRRFRSNITYYSASGFTDPSRCPSNFEIDEEERLTEPPSTARAHVKFLYDLYRLRTLNPELYDTYTKFVSRQELGLVSRLTWKEIELSSTTGEVTSGKVKKTRKRKTLVIPKVQIGSSYMTFNQLSEGTFKTLALVFYIMTDNSSCLLIEEPEVCVHYGLLAKTIETLKAYSSTKQVVFSTHSDLVLDQLEPENVFVVEMRASGSSVKALENWVGKRGRRALHEYLSETGSLGEYWRAGGLS